MCQQKSVLFSPQLGQATRLFRETGNILGEIALHDEAYENAKFISAKEFNPLISSLLPVFH